MSKTPDKRRRGDLELFVLALIDDGVSTPYELQRAAGLSPGATIPVLRRLLEGGFVRVGKAGLRGRMSYGLTAGGRQRLKVGWKDLIDIGPGSDLDADLRVALLALFIGGSRRLAVEFLRTSGARKLESHESIYVPTNLGSGSRLAAEYGRLRAVSAKTLVKGEVAAAKAIARSFPNSVLHRQRPSVKKQKA